MPDLHADDDAILRFSSSIAGHAATTATAYSAAWVHVPPSAEGQVFRNFLNTAQETEVAVSEGLTRLRDLLACSASELAAVAETYRATDASVATEMDLLLSRVSQRATHGSAGA